MSCAVCNCNPCCCKTPDVTQEPLASEVDNFVLALYGVVNKAIVDGAFQWTLPCNLSTNEPVAGFPRLPNEGSECYLLRLFEYLNSVIGGGISFPILITQGGTGATNVAGALANLGISLPMSLGNGGTGGTDAPSARAGIDAQQHCANLDLWCAIDPAAKQDACANLTTWCGKTVPSGDVVGTTDGQTLQLKTLQNCAVKQQTLIDNANIDWDASLGDFGTVTIGADRHFNAPTNLVPGTYYLMVLGAHAISTWDVIFQWIGGTPPVFAGAKNLITFVYDGTNMVGAGAMNIS